MADWKAAFSKLVLYIQITKTLLGSWRKLSQVPLRANKRCIHCWTIKGKEHTAKLQGPAPRNQHSALGCCSYPRGTGFSLAWFGVFRIKFWMQLNKKKLLLLLQREPSQHSSAQGILWTASRAGELQSHRKVSKNQATSQGCGTAD